jgi:hypothetical protein
MQDSDGASIASTPFNAAPSQALDLELEFGDEDGETLPLPEPQTATLNVIKEVICTQDLIETGRCPAPEQFGITVFGENPNPISFEGSATGRLVTLEPGEYHVDETEAPILPSPIITLEPAYSADCSGQIEAGQELTCTVTNEFMSRPAEPQTCIECFTAFLSETEIRDGLNLIGFSSLADACYAIESYPTGTLPIVESTLSSVGVDEETISEVIECLERVLGLQT